MANPYIEFVKEWRKSNPDVSYKDALKQASVDYNKSKDSSNNQSKDSSKSVKVERNKLPKIPKSKNDKNTRSRALTMYKKLLSNVEKKISNNQVLEENEYGDYRKLANELRGNSNTNQYAKKLKEIDRKLKSKKYQKLATNLSDESKKLTMKITDKKKTKLDKDKVLNEVFDTGVRKSERQDKRRRQLARLTDSKGVKKYDKRQIEEIIKLEDLGLSARELKETTTALGKYLEPDYIKEFLRINPLFSRPNARAYITLNSLFKSNPFEVPIITDPEVLKIAKKSGAFTTLPSAPPPPAPVISIPTTKPTVKLSKKQQQNYDEIIGLFGRNDLQRDLSAPEILTELYTDDGLTTKAPVVALQKKIESLKKNYDAGAEIVKRLSDIEDVLNEFLVKLPDIRSAAKAGGKAGTPTGTPTPTPTTKKKFVIPKTGGAKSGNVGDMLKQLAKTKEQRDKEAELEDAKKVALIESTELRDKLVKNFGGEREARRQVRKKKEKKETDEYADGLSKRFGESAELRSQEIIKEKAEKLIAKAKEKEALAKEKADKIKLLDESTKEMEKDIGGKQKRVNQLKDAIAKKRPKQYNKVFERQVSLIANGKAPIAPEYKRALESALDKNTEFKAVIEKIKKDGFGTAYDSMEEEVEENKYWKDFIKDAEHNLAIDFGYETESRELLQTTDRIEEIQAEVSNLKTQYPDYVKPKAGEPGFKVESPPTSGDEDDDADPKSGDDAGGGKSGDDDALTGAGFVDLIQRGMGRGNDVQRVSKVGSEDKKYAEISHAVYDPPQSRPKLILGYRLMDTPEYNEDRRVIYSKSNDDIIIGYRGTDDARDVMTDAKLALGNLKSTFRFKKDLNWTHDVMAELSPSKVVFCGHSLGGTIAIEMCDIFRGNTRAVVFNAGQGLKMGNRNHLNIRFYSVKGDFVSMLGTGAYKEVRILANDKTAKNKTPLGAHSTTNFDVGNAENFEETKEEPEEEVGGGLYSKMKSGFNSVGEHINMKNFKKATEILGDMEKLNDMMPEKYQNSMLSEINSIKKILVG